MNRQQSQRILNACKLIGVPATTQCIGMNDYSIFVYHHSLLTYTSYQAARLFILSREIETGRTI